MSKDDQSQNLLEMSIKPSDGKIAMNLHFPLELPALSRIKLIHIGIEGLLQAGNRLIAEAEIEDPDDFLDPPSGQINHPDDPGREPE
tara:strand:- start:20836 stop:21096 length:261 start_codon:yes stop_codon:yes gene_type:complete